MVFLNPSELSHDCIDHMRVIRSLEVIPLHSLLFLGSSEEGHKAKAHGVNVGQLMMLPGDRDQPLRIPSSSGPRFSWSEPLTAAMAEDAALAIAPDLAAREVL